MRIYLDECVPRPLRRELPGHYVRTAREMGWLGKANGELIALVTSNNFDIFLTVDQNLAYQQSIGAIRIAVVIIVARTNRLADLLPLMHNARATIDKVKPGDWFTVSA